MTERRVLEEVANRLDERRAGILERWRDRVRRDVSLATTTDWTRKQFYDHFPDVLEAFSRILRCWPEPAVSAEADQFQHAHAHAKTRWVQGYSLRDLIREWSHFNASVVHELNVVRTGGLSSSADAFLHAETLWADLAGEQLSESAAEYQRLHQAEAATRAEELTAMLERLQDLTRHRAHSLSNAVAGFRGELSTVMLSNALAGSAATETERAELEAMSRDSVNTLDRALADMVLLTRLEAKLDARDIAQLDAGEALTLLLAGMAPQAEQAARQLTWGGPESYPVEGDAQRLRLIARHLILTGLQSDTPGPIDVEWGDDAREPSRWCLTVRQHVGATSQPASPAIARVIADATDRAQQAAGIPPTGFEGPLIEGVIPVAAKDGVHLLIAKHLCEMLDASIELQAGEGISTFRVSLPRKYA